MLQANRGWSDSEWNQRQTELQQRGLLDHHLNITPTGRELRAQIEHITDTQAATPYAAVDERIVAELSNLLDPIVRTIAAIGVIPYPNPMGLPRL